MNDYVKMLERHQEELAQFPIVYAFGQEQFEKAMQKLGLEASDTEEVCSIFGAGDIIRKSDAPKFLDLLKNTTANCRRPSKQIRQEMALFLKCSVRNLKTTNMVIQEILRMH